MGYAPVLPRSTPCLKFLPNYSLTSVLFQPHVTQDVSWLLSRRSFTTCIWATFSFFRCLSPQIMIIYITIHSATSVKQIVITISNTGPPFSHEQIAIGNFRVKFSTSLGLFSYLIYGASSLNHCDFVLSNQDSLCSLKFISRMFIPLQTPSSKSLTQITRSIAGFILW